MICRFMKPELTIAQFYQDAWLNLVDAIASLIDEDSEFVFDALDGKLDIPVAADADTETSAEQSTAPARRNSSINYREEPVAFFFVLFGLAFEALVQRPSAGTDSVTASARTLEILMALKKILRPSVSGNAIYQEVIFAETMDIFGRMALTESADIQTVIVEVARNLCVGHPSSRQGTADEDNDHLSDDIDQLFELTRIIVLVLAGLIPGLGPEANRSNMTAAGMTDESVGLAILSLDALVTASSVFPSIIKSDLHACIFHIFTIIMSSPLCQPSLVPQTLPIFRRFVIDITAGIGPLSGGSETATQIQATLSRFLLVIKNAQKREIEHALLAEKNTLLAATMLVTSASSAFSTIASRPSSSSSSSSASPSNDDVVTRFLTELCDCLTNRMTTSLAAGCIRSLLLSPYSSSSVSAAMTAHLLPKVFSFLMTPSDLEGIPDSRVLLTSTLAKFAATSPPSSRVSVFAMTIPVLLVRAKIEGSGKAETEIAGRLLELVAVDATAFKSVVARMDTEMKSFLQGVLTSARVSSEGVRDAGAGEDDEEEEKPRIALRMDF